MKTAYTPDSVTAAERLHAVAANVLPDKATLAAIVAESFINGMTAQERMANSSAPAAERK